MGETGSLIKVWDSHFGPRNYHIDGEIVYGVPNDGRGPILNIEHVKGRIAMVDRGGDIPLVDKVRNLQIAGAIACIIVDNGICTESFECGQSGSKSSGNGFAY